MPTVTGDGSAADPKPTPREEGTHDDQHSLARPRSMGGRSSELLGAEDRLGSDPNLCDRTFCSKHEAFVGLYLGALDPTTLHHGEGTNHGDPENHRRDTLE